MIAVAATETTPKFGHVLEHMTVGGGIAVLGLCVVAVVVIIGVFLALRSFFGGL